MAVLSRTNKKVVSKVQPRNRARPAVEEEVDEEVETKEESKAVAVPKSLAEIVTKWATAKNTSDMFFARVVQLVIEEDFDRNEVLQALIEHRKMIPVTAGTEASVIMRVKGYPTEVKRCLAGKMTVRDLRECGKEKRTTQPTDEAKAEKKLATVLKNIAKFAIMTIGYEKADFLKAASAAYRVADGIVEQAKEEAREKGEGEEEPAEEEAEAPEDEFEEEEEGADEEEE